MDRAEFDRAKEWARFLLRHSPMGNKSSGEALLAVTDNGDPSIKAALIAISFTERWAWDATLAMAQEWLRAEAWIPRQETLPDSVRSPLANWTADVLAKKMKPPPKGGNRLANRDALIAEVVYLLTVLFELKPTRNSKKKRLPLPESCAEGGSACDVVGDALCMSYKAVEKAWTRYGGFVSERLDGKHVGQILSDWAKESALSSAKSGNK